MVEGRVFIVLSGHFFWVGGVPQESKNSPKAQCLYSQSEFMKWIKEQLFIEQI